MTQPESVVMPYGVTLIPSAASGIYLVVDPKAGSKRFGTTGIIVPTGVFMLSVNSSLSGDVGMRTNYTDGSPVGIKTAIEAGGGAFSTVLSGENIQYLQFTCATQQADFAVGKRATVWITPIPDPI